MKLFNIDDVTKLNARFIMAHTDTIRASLRGPDLETHRGLYREQARASGGLYLREQAYYGPARNNRSAGLINKPWGTKRKAVILMTSLQVLVFLSGSVSPSAA